MSINVVVPVPLSVVSDIKDGVSAEKDEEAYYDLIWTAGVSLVEAVRNLPFDIRPSGNPKTKETTKTSWSNETERNISNNTSAQASEGFKPKGTQLGSLRKQPAKLNLTSKSAQAPTPIQSARPIQTSTTMRTTTPVQSPRPDTLRPDTPRPDTPSQDEGQRPIWSSGAWQTQEPAQGPQVIQNEDRMQLFVRTVTGLTSTIEVAGTSTTTDLARAIEVKEGIPVEDQRLIFGGRQLLINYYDFENTVYTTTLASYGVKSESTIHLVQRSKLGLGSRPRKFSKQIAELIQPSSSTTPIQAPTQARTPRPIASQRALVEPQRTFLSPPPQRPVKAMQVTVKTINGETSSFECNVNTTTYDLAEAVEAKWGIPIKDQCLLFRHMKIPLHDLTLISLGIRHESTLHLTSPSMGTWCSKPHSAGMPSGWFSLSKHSK